LRLHVLSPLGLAIVPLVYSAIELRCESEAQLLGDDVPSMLFSMRPQAFRGAAKGASGVLVHLIYPFLDHRSSVLVIASISASRLVRGRLTNQFIDTSGFLRFSR